VKVANHFAETTNALTKTAQDAAKTINVFRATANDFVETPNGLKKKVSDFAETPNDLTGLSEPPLPPFRVGSQPVEYLEGVPRWSCTGVPHL